MIFRLSQRLNAKIRAGTLAAVPLDENPLADWSAALFVAGRTQYIMVSNTKSLYSTVLPGKGVTDHGTFIERALNGVRASLAADGQGGVYSGRIGPAGITVRFAKALDRSVTGSMNDLIRHATAWLTDGDVSLPGVGARLNDTLLSALATGISAPYGRPREAFKALSAPPASRPRTGGGDAGG
jgi:hypothetical protein